MKTKTYLSVVCALLVSYTATASGITGSWAGTYGSASKPCYDYPIVIAENSVTLGSCKYKIVKVLTSTEKEFAVQLEAKDKCGWAEISMQKTEDGGVDVTFNSGPVMGYCFYGKEK